MGRTAKFPKISLLTVLITQSFAIPAFAAGFQINEISPSLQGDATAGAAAANNDVSASFTNPATLMTLIKNQLYVGGSEILPHVRVDNESAIHTVNIPGIPPSSLSAQVQGKTSQGSISKSAFIPNLYLSWRLNERLVTGISVTAPFGLTTSYDENSVIRFAADNSAVKTIDITPSFAFAVTPQLTLGAGVQFQYIQANFSNFNGPYTGTPLDAFVAANHPTYVNGSAWGYGYTLGALIHPDELTRLGVGFRSAISSNLKGKARQFIQPGGVVPAPSNAFLYNAGSTANAAVRTPAVLTLSAARDIGDWTVKASAQVNFWNTFGQLSINLPGAYATNSNIQTHWKDVVMGALGADYRINKQFTARAGFAYDPTPTRNDFRDPRIPDADRYWLAFGGTYKYNEHFSLDAAYTHIFMHPQQVRVTQASGSSVNSTVPLEVNQVNASYKGSADVLGLAMRYTF